MSPIILGALGLGIAAIIFIAFYVIASLSSVKQMITRIIEDQRTMLTYLKQIDGQLSSGNLSLNKVIKKDNSKLKKMHEDLEFENTYLEEEEEELALAENEKYEIEQLQKEEKRKAEEKRRAEERWEAERKLKLEEEREAEEKWETERKLKLEEEREAEEKRKIEEERRAEEKWETERKLKLEEERKAEEKREREEKRRAEKRRELEEKRRAARKLKLEEEQKRLLEDSDDEDTADNEIQAINEEETMTVSEMDETAIVDRSKILKEKIHKEKTPPKKQEKPECFGSFAKRNPTCATKCPWNKECAQEIKMRFSRKKSSR